LDLLAAVVFYRESANIHSTRKPVNPGDILHM